MNTSPCAHFSIRKILGPANRGEADLPSHHHIIRATGAVDDHDIAAAVKAADNTDMAVAWIEDKVSRLGVTPSNRRTVAVLRSGPSAMPNDVLSAGLVVEYPIDKSTAIHPVGPVGAGGGAARRRDLPQLSPSGVPAENKALDSDR